MAQAQAGPGRAERRRSECSRPNRCVATAKSCGERLAGVASLADGTYQLVLDATGPFPSLLPD